MEWIRRSNSEVEKDNPVQKILVNTPKIGLGSLKISLGTVWGTQYFTVWGGPYKDRPFEECFWCKGKAPLITFCEACKGSGQSNVSLMRTVKLAKEVDAPYDVSIPTQDFSCPDKKLLYRGLYQTVEFVLKGYPVYVGCMGGRGRTGLFLAVLCKAFGIKKPVEYVRKNYYPHAVETQAQYNFVKDFIIAPQVRIAIKKARRKYWVKFWKTELTRKLNLTN